MNYYYFRHNHCRNSLLVIIHMINRIIIGKNVPKKKRYIKTMRTKKIKQFYWLKRVKIR